MDIEDLDIDGEDGRRLREIIIETLQFRAGQEMEPVDELEEIILNPDYPDQKIKIGGQLSLEEREEIIALLRN